MQNFSEYGEDQWIMEHWSRLNLNARTYVDIGCAHPIQYSNSAFLRAYSPGGWRGLAIDGNAAYAPHWAPEEKLFDVKFVNVAIGGDPAAKFWVEANTAFSRLIDPSTHAAALQTHARDQAAAVPVTPLQAVLNTFGLEKIDFLSLDLEGGEFDALMTFDLKRHAPSIIVSEYNTSGTLDYRVRDHLLATGDYEAVHQTIANIIYFRK